jgi:hypothetical protein
MTCLKIVLALPYGDQENEFDHVVCNGVVVRVEEVSDESNVCSAYNIAIYFNEIQESEKKKMAKFFGGHQGPPELIC